MSSTSSSSNLPPPAPQDAPSTDKDTSSTDATETSTATANKTKKRHGADFTPRDLQLTAKAYMIVSEDPILGIGQKSATFFNRVALTYNKLIEDDDTYEKKKAAIALNAGKTVEYVPNRVERTANSLAVKWRKNIAPTVTKLVGIERTVLKGGGPSGTNGDMEILWPIINNLYKERNNGECAEKYQLSWEYLRKKPKFFIEDVLVVAHGDGMEY